MGIIFPFATGVATICVSHITLHSRGGWCNDDFNCGCRQHTFRDVIRRVSNGLIGLFHLFVWPAGYIVASTLLFIAAVLPTKIADFIVDYRSSEIVPVPAPNA